ncbi:MAG: HlyD family efflux transporter periplasmic adaptor subunit [Roseburia sp.]|nr:HlyD family efflux transporter periplasmic adaptor subunit [Roseburia sp.]MCM1096455.1 HlyD family efflux transporter periplasmic adaptor subunit [Ruminococcus flavefaciens]
MNDNGTKRREWVKTAAIIFLSVMLVLTFFSQTILNYSLPEVATQYVQSGAITAKIRGSGTVESGDPYEVKVTESRKVSSVAVHVGDTVQKGDVLLYLEDAESEELKAARKALEDAENAYELAVLTAEISSSNIHYANEGVSAEVYRQQITNAQAAEQRAEKAYNTAVDEAKAAKEAEKPYEQQVAQAEQTITDYTNQITHDSNQDVINRSQEKVKTTKAAYDAALDAYNTAVEAWMKANDDFNAATVSGGDTNWYQVKVSEAEQEKNKKKTEMDSKYTEWQNAVNSENNREAAVKNLSAGKADWELQREILAKNLTTAQAATKEKEAAVETAKAEWDEKKAALSELVGNISNVVNLEQMLDAIADAQKLVDELTEKAIDATVKADIAGTVTAVNVTAGNMTSAATPVAVLQPEGKGYTLSFSVTNEQAKRLSVGDRADLVNSWWYNDVEAVLASIQPDRSNPGQQKLLTFNITGEVTAGQNLNLSVGQKSANYDLIVPNSAIREDSNGKFILIVESRPSPLGNRYVATRVDVEVLASDDTQTAISGALYGYEYVITTSTKPVEAGKQVRLADN